MSETDDEGRGATPELVETHVVTVFLRSKSDVLLLRRSDAVGSYTGRWGAVAGHAEGDPPSAARDEIREETGIDPDRETTLVRRGDSFEVTDTDLGTRWVVHPFLFDCETRSVHPNEETSEYEWVSPTEIRRRETVPDLWTSYDLVRPTPETVASDSEHGAAHISIRALEVLRDEAALAVEHEGADECVPSTWEDLLGVARDLLDARESMAVVRNRVDRAVHAASESATPAALETAATDGIDRATDADDDAAALAAAHLPDRIATLSRSGTVATAVERAAPTDVLVAESRPGEEGVTTAERFAETTDATVRLTTDAALAERLVHAGVQALVVGADTVLPDGCVCNKVGTRAAATVAASEGIDCYVVAASDKIAPSGGADEVDREERDPAEVYDGEAAIRVENPTFDVTPAERFDALLTERGVLDADAVSALAADHRSWADWRG